MIDGLESLYFYTQIQPGWKLPNVCSVNWHIIDLGRNLIAYESRDCFLYKHIHF